MICGNNYFLSFEKRHILYNGIFGCHENICYVILINAFVLQSTWYKGPINFEINRYKIDEFRKHAKIVCFI